MAGKGSLSGVILLDKPEGITSHDAVVAVRKALAVKRVGHAGTLDPFATGLLIILVGEGTKLSGWLMADEKTYLAGIRLGERTDTGDPTGKVVDRIPLQKIDAGDVERVLARFTGRIRQIPPMYSALKRHGEPLYRLAREGREVARESREVFIDRIELLRFEPPFLDIAVTCSKGTYIRTLAEDIAVALGTCGHLFSLRRTASGPFTVDKALTMEDLGDREKLSTSIIPLRNALPRMREITVRAEAVTKILNGALIRGEWIAAVDDGVKAGDMVKVVDTGGRLLSIAEVAVDPKRWTEKGVKGAVGRSVRVINVRN